MQFPLKKSLIGLGLIIFFASIPGCESLNIFIVQPSRTTGTPQSTDSDQVAHPTTLQSLESGTSIQQAPAFPGAEGFGAKSIGGRGGKIIEVINLNDSGPGSLRSALDEEGPRIVVFRIGGTIELKSGIEITNPYITIAGQTAPGGGITLANHPTNPQTPLVIRTHDVILRYIRSRPGASDQKSENGDAIEILGPEAFNIIVDHCSFSWAIDEVASIWYDAHDITIQWSIISEGLHCSQHVKGCHSMGLLVGSEGANHISIHHNLLAHNHERNPLIETSGLVDVVNNVIYNSWGSPILFSDENGKVLANVLGNYQKDGPDSDSGKYLLSVQVIQGNDPEIFVQGNITPLRPKDSLNQLLVVKPNSKEWIAADLLETEQISTERALQAYERVLADAGASMGLDNAGQLFLRQDDVDLRIIFDVINGTGKIIDNPFQVGGWPKLAEGSPPVDSDRDGMSDLWEQMYGFHPSDPQDGPLDADGDGYTNVEEYLNTTYPRDSQK